MRRALIIIAAVFTVASLLTGGGADAGPAPEDCPPGLLLEPDNDSPGGMCLCPDSGEAIGWIGDTGVYAPFPVDPDRYDTDGDCTTDPRPSSVPGEEEPQPEARTQQTAPTLPGEPVYPVPDAAPAGPVEGVPSFTG